jgi:hypothetical protein
LHPSHLQMLLRVNLSNAQGLGNHPSSNICVDNICKRK